MNRDWITSALTAFLFHAVLFFGTGFAFVQAPQFGMEASSGGIEVSLIAAPPPTAEKAATVSDLETQSENEDGEEVIEELKKKQEVKAASVKNPEDLKKYSFVNNTPFKGDGSSAVPGQSPTTFYSPGGGNVDNKAGYLKNPPPQYPQAAVRKKQEGLVLLTVTVSGTGQAQKVEIKKSSQYPLLDEAALKAIRRWKFDPAHLGLIHVDSQIDIPIRFVLEDELKRLHRA